MYCANDTAPIQLASFGVHIHDTQDYAKKTVVPQVIANIIFFAMAVFTLLGFLLWWVSGGLPLWHRGFTASLWSLHTRAG